MTSIFDLKTNVDELSSTNEGTSRMEYDQHPPTRDVVNDNFANGAIHFRFQTSGQKWWIPSRSYLRMRCQLTNGDGTRPINVGDDVAPNMDLMPNLFQSMEMRINDKVVSRVADFVPQVDAIETRLTKSSSWLEGVGDATNFWEKDYKKRQADVASDGVAFEVSTTDSVQTPPFTRAAMGFDGAGGTQAERNQFGYVEATGILTYDQGTDGNGIADIRNVYNVGDYFLYTTIQGAAANDPRLNKPALILEITSATSMRVQTGVIGGNVATDGRTDFAKIVKAAGGDNVARRAGQFELTWTPCALSLFKVGHALPSGRYELVLNPQTQTSFQKRAIQSLLANKTPTLPGNNQDYRFRVVDFYLYCATVEGPRADDITYLLDLEQTRCQSEKIDNVSFQQKNFDVSPSTYALTVAYQDLRAGQDTRASPSIFKSYNAALDNVSTEVGNVSEELKLNRLFINYAGQNLPAPDADPNFVAQDGTINGGIDYTVQRYTESQIYSGAMFDTGGAESLSDWHDRGSYYYFSWPRDGTDRSTRVNVHQQFQQTADVANLRCLLFDHSKQVARVRVQDGRVVDVQVEDA